MDARLTLSEKERSKDFSGDLLASRRCKWWLKIIDVVLYNRIVIRDVGGKR